MTRDLSWFQQRIRRLEEALAAKDAELRQLEQTYARALAERPEPEILEVEVLPSEFAEGLARASETLSELADRARAYRHLRIVPTEGDQDGTQHA